MGGFEYRAAGKLLRSVAAGLRVGESQVKTATMMRQFAISLQNSGRMHNVVKLTNDNEKVSRGRSATSRHRGGTHPGLSQGTRLPLGFEA